MGLQKQACADLLKRFDPMFEFDPENQDMLNVLMGVQLDFRKMLGGKSPVLMNGVEKSHRIQEHMEALTHECAELRELLAWKHWKQYPADFKIDIEEARFEVADMMCFLMNIAILLGMDAKSLFIYTNAKQQHNVERQQDSKYGYVTQKPVSKTAKKKGTGKKTSKKRRLR